jgi:hypothetical protein
MRNTKAWARDDGTSAAVTAVRLTIKPAANKSVRFMAISVFETPEDSTPEREQVFRESWRGCSIPSEPDGGGCRRVNAQDPDALRLIILISL